MILFKSRYIKKLQAGGSIPFYASFQAQTAEQPVAGDIRYMMNRHQAGPGAKTGSSSGKDVAFDDTFKDLKGTPRDKMATFRALQPVMEEIEAGVRGPLGLSFLTDDPRGRDLNRQRNQILALNMSETVRIGGVMGTLADNIVDYSNQWVVKNNYGVVRDLETGAYKEIPINELFNEEGEQQYKTVSHGELYDVRFQPGAVDYTNADGSKKNLDYDNEIPAILSRGMSMAQAKKEIIDPLFNGIGMSIEGDNLKIQGKEVAPNELYDYFESGKTGSNLNNLLASISNFYSNAADSPAMNAMKAAAFSNPLIVAEAKELTNSGGKYVSPLDVFTQDYLMNEVKGRLKITDLEEYGEKFGTGKNKGGGGGAPDLAGLVPGSVLAGMGNTYRRSREYEVSKDVGGNINSKITVSTYRDENIKGRLEPNTPLSLQKDLNQFMVINEAQLGNGVSMTKNMKTDIASWWFTKWGKFDSRLMDMTMLSPTEDLEFAVLPVNREGKILTDQDVEQFIPLKDKIEKLNLARQNILDNDNIKDKEFALVKVNKGLMEAEQEINKLNSQLGYEMKEFYVGKGVAAPYNKEEFLAEFGLGASLPVGILEANAYKTAYGSADETQPDKTTFITSDLVAFTMFIPAETLTARISAGGVDPRTNKEELTGGNLGAGQNRISGSFNIMNVLMLNR